MPPALFVSDLHLSPARPALLDTFDAFCAGPAQRAGSLYVLGDLFDTWIGDDQLRDPVAARVAAALRNVSAARVPVGVIYGNRDMLIGRRFGEATGATLLPEQVVVDLHGVPTLLLHGDELCTDDEAYQRLRRWWHDRTRQRRFLALPYALRRGIGAWLRRKSRKATAGKARQIMDVNPEAVLQTLRAHGVSRMIHGHTHRPARHDLAVDGRACERWVLSDWYERGSYLEVDGAGARTREVG